MKSDSYARFLRSNVYQDLLTARKKVRLAAWFLHTFIPLTQSSRWFNVATATTSERLPLTFSPVPLQPETEQGRRTSLEKFTRSVVSVIIDQPQASLFQLLRRQEEGRGRFISAEPLSADLMSRDRFFSFYEIMKKSD